MHKQLPQPPQAVYKPPAVTFTLHRGIGGLLAHQQEVLSGAPQPASSPAPTGTATPLQPATGRALAGSTPSTALALTAGAGQDGKLGQGALTDSPAFASVNALASRPLTRVFCGSYNTVFLTERDEMYLCGLLLSPKDGSSLVGKHPTGTTKPPIPPRSAMFQGRPLRQSSVPKPAPTAQPAHAQQGQGQAQGAPQASQENVFTSVPMQYHLPRFGAKVRQIALGNYHALLLTDAGKVYSWGSSRYGQLGLGSTLPAAAPEPVNGVSCVCAIACGTTYSAAVTEWGELYTWGENTMFQLGLGDSRQRQNPTRVNKLRSYAVKSVACGSTHTVCLTSGTADIYHWGQCSKEGKVQPLPTQLDLSTVIEDPVSVIKISCGGWHTDFVLNTGNVVEWKLGEQPRKIIGVLSNHSVRAIVSGNFHSVCLTDTGRVFSWGRNTSSQLGRPGVQGTDPLPDEVSGLGWGEENCGVMIAAGELHSAVLLDKNKRFAASRKLLAQVREYFRVLVLIARGYMVPLFDRLASPDSKVSLPSDVQLQRKSISAYLTRTKSEKDVKEKDKDKDKDLGAAGRSASAIWSNEKKAPTNIDEPISEDELKIIFTGIDELTASTAKLLNTLDERISEWGPNQTIADVFLTDEFADVFRQYITYSDNYNEGQMTLYNARKRSITTMDTLRELEGQSRTVVMPCPSDLELKTLLIAPVQFIARLALSLQELAECTESRHADFALLMMIREKLSLLLGRINENFQFTNVMDVLHCTADEFGNPQIMGGTVESLVEKLTHHSVSDPKFRDIFLLTFRTFLEPRALLTLVTARYTSNKGAPWSQRQRVFHVISEWVTGYFQRDFVGDEQLLSLLCTFLEQDCTDDDEARNYCQHILELIDQQSEIAAHPEPAAPLMLEEVRAQQLPVVHLFGSLPADVVANCLALIDHEYFEKVTVLEFFGKLWEKPEASTRVPALSACIARFNRLSTWVSLELGKVAPHKSSRATMASYLLSVAESSLELNNLNAFVAITYGLSSCRKDLPKEVITKLDEYERICSPTRNYKELRKLQAELRPPCVPFMAIALKDITFIEDGNPDVLSSAAQPKPAVGSSTSSTGTVINFFKRRKFAGVVLQLRQYQQVRYQSEPKPDPALWAYLVLLDPAAAAAQAPGGSTTPPASITSSPRPRPRSASGNLRPRSSSGAKK